MAKKTVLLTRSYQENIELVNNLQPKGYDCISCAMLEYQIIPFDYSVLDDFSNIVITSKYAANLLGPNLSDHQVFVVGALSARILEDKGYKVAYIANNASELKQYLEFKDIKGIYLSSNHITIDMPTNVKKHNFYRVAYANDLSQEQLNAIKKGVDYILLYSENCAKTLVKLILEKQLLKYLANSVVITISSKVENVVKPYLKNSFAQVGAMQMIDFLESYDKKKR